jgi:hypothetical protein
MDSDNRGVTFTPDASRLFGKKGPRVSFKGEGDNAHREKHEDGWRHEKHYTAAIEVTHLVEPRDDCKVWCGPRC